MLFIQQLLQEKLKEELINDICQKYHNGSLPDEISSLPFDKVEEKVKQLSERYSSRVIEILPPVTISSEGTCCARIWNNKQGGKCKRKCQPNKEYCKGHQDQLDECGYLRFRRFDEPRPILNEQGNKFPWNDGIESLDMLMRYQRSLLHHLISTSFHSDERI